MLLFHLFIKYLLTHSWEQGSVLEDNMNSEAWS